MRTVLEVSSESYPANWWVIGEVHAVPAPGDFVQFEVHGFSGYVRRRRFKFSEDGCVVRVWIHKDP